MPKTFADAALDTNSNVFVLDCHVRPNNRLHATVRNIPGAMFALAAATLSAGGVKRRVP
jgi:hypothetical protein